MSLFDLQGRRALLTGSYRGLGAVFARGLAEAGAAVVLNGRNRNALEQTVAQLRTEGHEAYGFAFDITDERQVEESIREIESRIGPIDILVNNAGIQKRAPLHEFPTEDWQAILSTHLTGAFLVSRRVVGGMIDREQGKIINICSVASEAGRQGIGPYTAAKGGLLMLTRAMCADWARYNIQINGISPGYFITDMTRSMAENPAFNGWVIARTPAGRWGKPEELVGVLLLLSSDASSFINGQIFTVDGGVLATM
ncbi:MAG TPA: SDR family oxidoreductase [Spirochaetia bacterium]|nr:SDR family oxidoreductase [Spirochaetia bacterium]